MEQVDKMLVEKWDKILNVSGKGVKALDEDSHAGMAQLLENQQNWINENQNQASDIGIFTPILVPTARRIGAGLVANYIVGKQPMKTPNGFAFAWRSHYRGSNSNPVSGGTAPLHRGATTPAGPASGSVVVLVPSATAVVVGEIVRDTTGGGGNDHGTVAYFEITDGVKKVLINLALTGSQPDATVAFPMTVASDVYFNGANAAAITMSDVVNNELMHNLILKNYTGPMNTATGEQLGDEMASVGVSMERASVTAETRKLKAEYTVEMAQDLQAQFGMNAEQELMNVMQYEIAAEIDRDLVSKINDNSTTVTGWTYSLQNAGYTAAGTIGTGTSDGGDEQSKFRTLYTKIVKEANMIAVATRRGAGNYVLCSPNVVSALEGLNNFMYSQVSNDFGLISGINRVGTLDGRFAVYVDTFAVTDYCTVGYKGPGNLDTGVIYCPYIPVMTQKIVHEKTFQPAIGMMTRDAVMYNLNGTASYYRKFACDFTGSQLGSVAI